MEKWENRMLQPRHGAVSNTSNRSSPCDANGNAHPSHANVRQESFQDAYGGRKQDSISARYGAGQGLSQGQTKWAWIDGKRVFQGGDY